MLFYYCSLFLAAIVLLYYNYKNDYKRIERHYFKENRKLYFVLRAAHFILLASIVLNVRYILYSYAGKVLKGKK